MKHRVLLLTLTAAGLLRGLRVIVRWDEVSWQYAAYTGPMVEKLRSGDWSALLDFTGLHPPLWYLLQSLGEIAVPVPLLWVLFSASCSLGVVALYARRPVIAALLATSPIQLSYAAELNNYPLTALVIAGLWALREKPRAFCILALLAPWTHGLAGFVALVLAGLERNKIALGVLTLSTLPLLPGIAELALEAGTYVQPPLDLELSARDYLSRFGPIALLLVPLACIGGWRQRRVAAGLGLSAVFVLVLVLVGIAAPHQFPYHLAFGVPFAILVANSGWPRVAVAVALVQGLWFGAYDLRRIELIAFDDERAVDAALSRAHDGDGVYLLAPHLRNDDDKGASSPVLWRLPPWRRMPAAQPYELDYDDFRHGQPRLVDGLTVYVNDELREQLELAVAAHATLWLVVYEHREDPRFTKELEERFGPSERFGSDRLWELHP